MHPSLQEHSESVQGPASEVVANLCAEPEEESRDLQTRGSAMERAFALLRSLDASEGWVY